MDQVTSLPSTISLCLTSRIEPVLRPTSARPEQGQGKSAMLLREQSDYRNERPTQAK